MWASTILNKPFSLKPAPVGWVELLWLLQSCVALSSIEIIAVVSLHPSQLRKA